MTERRYNDTEISAIFAKAVEGPQPAALQAARDQGLTLAELQQIGREVGLSPETVAHAARTFDTEPLVEVRRFLGMPIGVDRIVTLDRWMTEAEWEHLVVRLREVFRARGRVSAHGNFRQWTNGNLQALLEPTPTGHRLRLTTTKGSARSGIGAGAVAIITGGVVAAAGAAAGHLAAATPGIMTMVLMGTAMIAYSVLPLRSWAEERGRQMDEIINRLRAPSQQ
jgi:hypothetical protein